MNNGSHLKQIVELGKWVTFEKMATQKNMGCTYKIGLHLGKWVTLGKMGHT